MSSSVIFKCFLVWPLTMCGIKVNIVAIIVIINVTFFIVLFFLI